MSVICYQLKTLKPIANSKDIQALLIYPKLVLFEDLKSVRIINANDKDPETADDVISIELNEDIVDKFHVHNFIGLILKSGGFLIINCQTGSQMKILINNYKIKTALTNNSNVYLISESGECLTFPYNAKELINKFSEGIAEENTNLEKARIRRSELDQFKCKNYNGLQLYVNNGKICVKCPLTNIQEELISSESIENIIPWETQVVLANSSRMWIVDLADAETTFDFKTIAATYYPLAAKDNRFFYLIWNESEIQLCCALNASSTADPVQSGLSGNQSSNSVSSQEKLRLQLQELVYVALSGTEPAQVLPQLKNCFDKIEDFHFLIDQASKLCKHDLMYKSILYPLQRKVFSNGASELINVVSDLIIKTDLIEYIQFRGNKAYENVNLFGLNAIELCITFVSKSDLDLASICWLKYSEIDLNILPMNVLEILNAIPLNVKMGALIIWLKNFTPPLLDENPYIIDIFVKWTTQRVFSLEHSSYWPKIGLKFIDEILNVLENSLKTIPIRPISMDDLDVLKDHIYNIMELKENYKINMLLGEITSQSADEVALIMLRRCYTEDLYGFVNDYLPNFAIRHSFEMDDTLRTYVENEAATCGGGIDSSRLKILLNTFRSPTIKLDCLLQVLKVLDVPWDDNVLELAVNAAALVFKGFTVTDNDRNLAQEIQNELNYAKIKVILKKYNFPLTQTDYSVVLHKLINANNVDLHDLKVITSVTSAHSNYGNILYIDRCLRDCETSTALDFFNNLSQKEKKILIKAIIVKYEQIIKSNTHDNLIERNYLDFLNGTKRLNDIEMSSVNNLYHLKNSYNITLDLNNFHSEKSCTDITKSWLMNDGITASTGRGRCVSLLTGVDKSRNSKLTVLLCSTSTNSHKVRNLVESLLLPFSKKEKLLTNFKDGENSEQLLETFDVLIDLVSKCAEEDIHYVTGNLSFINSLINANITVKNLSIIWKFHYIYLDLSSIMSTNSYIDNYYNSSAETALENVKSMEYKSDFMAFRILSNITGRFDYFNSNFIQDYLKIRDSVSRKLISKIVTTQNIDEILLTSLLIIVNGAEYGEALLDMLQGQNDSMPLGITCYLSAPTIRRTFGLDNILPGNTVTYPPRHVLMSKFNINLADIALPDSTEETWDVKVILFYVLRQDPHTSFERLAELCRNLNVSLNDGLSLQLISLLTTWELKYKVYTDDLNCRHLYLENDEKKLTSTCLSIWDSISEKDFLRDILNDFWKIGEVTLHGRLISINPYFYEVYMCIFYLIYGSTLESRNKKEYFLLNFLKEYRRKSSPKQYEFELFSIKGMFPEIGYYRLPFVLFMRDDMWSNLKSEITLETYERWLPAVSLLSLDADLQTAKDMICSNALKQTMTTRQRNEVIDEDAKDKKAWRLTVREEPLLRAAHKCVKHIANMEWAGACLFYVLQGCARGADQVAASQLCYQFAQRWDALQPGNRAVRQMESLHSSISTRHALHKIGWACEDFLRLSAEPAQLIRAIYLHPNFVEKMARHDVNRAINEIADKNGINISSIRIQILESILLRSNEENKNSSVCGIDLKKLMTAKYILKATCPKMGAIYLSRIAFDDETDNDKYKKLRALQCLMSVVDTETAMKVTNRERDALWVFLLELLYTINLDNIDMPWIVSIFSKDKLRAVEQLIQAIGANSEGLKIAALLARRYGNVKTIREIIPLLLRANLHEEMIPLLLKVSSPPDDIIYTAWRAVILSPFQRADYPITERQKAMCLNAVNLLPVCPFIKDEDLIEVWKNCLRCKCFGLGCLVLPYITPEKRETLTELQKIDRRNIIASLKNLQTETYLVSGAMHVIENLTTRKYH